MGIAVSRKRLGACFFFFVPLKDPRALQTVLCRGYIQLASLVLLRKEVSRITSRMTRLHLVQVRALEQTKANLTAQLEQQAQELELVGEQNLPSSSSPPPPPPPPPVAAAVEDDVVTQPKQLQMTPGASSTVDVDGAAPPEVADDISSVHKAQPDQPTAPPPSGRGGVMGYFFGRRRNPTRQA